MGAVVVEGEVLVESRWVLLPVQVMELCSGGTPQS